MNKHLKLFFEWAFQWTKWEWRWESKINMKWKRRSLEGDTRLHWKTIKMHRYVVMYYEIINVWWFSLIFLSFTTSREIVPLSFVRVCSVMWDVGNRKWFSNRFSTRQIFFEHKFKWNTNLLIVDRCLSWFGLYTVKHKKLHTHISFLTT